MADSAAVSGWRQRSPKANFVASAVAIIPLAAAAAEGAAATASVEVTGKHHLKRKEVDEYAEVFDKRRSRERARNCRNLSRKKKKTIDERGR